MARLWTQCLQWLLQIFVISLIVFETTAITYDDTLAHRMMYFSRVAYCAGGDDTSLVSGWDCTACAVVSQTSSIAEVHVFNGESDADGMITYDSANNAITVSFAGSESGADWIINLSFTQKDYPACASWWFWVDDCSVHRGFYDAYQTVADDIYQIVKLWMDKYDNPTLEITGHSMGGALALLCALDLAINHDTAFQADYIYTFGQPRIGDDEFFEFYEESVGNDRTIRVTHRKDPVTIIPPATWNYMHMPVEVYYPDDSDGDYTVCDGSGEDANCIAQYTLSDIQIADFADHLIYLGISLGDSNEACSAYDDATANAMAKSIEVYAKEESESNNGKSGVSSDEVVVIVVVICVIAIIACAFGFGVFWVKKRKDSEKGKVEYNAVSESNVELLGVEPKYAPPNA